jgi:integrase
MGRYGAGTLFQRGKKGIWYYQAWANGQQIGPFSSKSTDRKVAERELDKLLGKRARGEIRIAKRDKDRVGDLLDEYVTYAEERLQSAKIIRWVIEAHIRPALGQLQVSRCDVHQLRKYRRDRRAQGADDVTINRELSYVRAAFRRALKESTISSVPYFPIVKEDNARQGFLEEEDFLRLLNELDRPLKPFSCCAYYVGMRRGEMLRLEIADVDLAGGFIEIRKTKNKDARLVPIFDGPMRQWLTDAIANRRAGQTKLFVWEDGQPFTERNFYDRWHAACKRAGVSGFIPHDSRRSASRNMRNEGIPRPLRKKIIGHRTDSMDERYGIVDIEDAKAVREIMSRKFGEGQTTAKTTAGQQKRPRKKAANY